MIIREIKKSDAEVFLKLCEDIDEESEFLLYEEGERKTTLQQQRNRLEELEYNDNSTIFIAEIDEEPIGYLIANGGKRQRNRHNVYIVIGIKSAYTGQGIGGKLFKKLEKWGKQRKVFRLELGLMDRNIPAFKLYKKMGFELEGVKKNAFCVNGIYVNEYIMAKFLTA